LRLLGQAISLAVARAPAVWPLLRTATRRFWERSAGTWDERIDPERPEHLAPLAAACDRLETDPGRILELGTGTGAGARMLARRFAKLGFEHVASGQASGGTYFLARRSQRPPGDRRAPGPHPGPA